MDAATALIKFLTWAERAGDEWAALYRLDADVEERLAHIPVVSGSAGVDPFGFDPAYLRRTMAVWLWLYRHYFRCQVFGAEHIPDGRCLVVANHSGQLPFDGAMLGLAAFLERNPPRVLRAMIERFVPSMPFVSTYLARCGQILGTPDNCRRVLQQEESILVFPEGVRGLNKTWRKRYQLQRFGQGFMRLALETKSPIVPAVVIGAEEQAPVVCNAKWLGKLFGLPALPVTLPALACPLLGLVPLPTRYRIYFGAPIVFDGDGNEEDSVVEHQVEQVRSSMQNMIHVGLDRRASIFF